MIEKLYFFVLLGVVMLTSGSTTQAPFRTLQGKIITSNQEISIPETKTNFIKKLRTQDQRTINQNENGSWDIYFVAFFIKPLPVDHIGMVVLDATGNPSTLAEFNLSRGQTNLAGHLVVDTTNTPMKKHLVQLYYVKNKRPIELASKAVVLK